MGGGGDGGGGGGSGVAAAKPKAKPRSAVAKGTLGDGVPTPAAIRSAKRKEREEAKAAANAERHANLVAKGKYSLVELYCQMDTTLAESAIGTLQCRDVIVSFIDRPPPIPPNTQPHTTTHNYTQTHTDTMHAQAHTRTRRHRHAPPHIKHGGTVDSAGLSCRLHLPEHVGSLGGRDGVVTDGSFVPAVTQSLTAIETV